MSNLTQTICRKLKVIRGASVHLKVVGIFIPINPIFNLQVTSLQPLAYGSTICSLYSMWVCLRLYLKLSKLFCYFLRLYFKQMSNNVQILTMTNYSSTFRQSTNFDKRIQSLELCQLPVTRSYCYLLQMYVPESHCSCLRKEFCLW